MYEQHPLSNHGAEYGEHSEVVSQKIPVILHSTGDNQTARPSPLPRPFLPRHPGPQLAGAAGEEAHLASSMKTSLDCEPPSCSFTSLPPARAVRKVRAQRVAGYPGAGSSGKPGLAVLLGPWGVVRVFFPLSTTSGVVKSRCQCHYDRVLLLVPLSTQSSLPTPCGGSSAFVLCGSTARVLL